MSKKVRKTTSKHLKKGEFKTDNTFLESNIHLTNEVELIRWDKRTYFFVGVMFLMYAIFVLFKLHGSSSGMWNQIMPAEGISKKSGIIFGTPKSIRSDEWLGQIPFHISQYYNDFNYQNQVMGPLNTPLMWNMPNHFWVNVIRPSFWGSYVFDLEREFSYFWCFRIFMTIIAYFLFFMLITQNNFMISVLGSLFGFLSAPNQWWSLYLGDMTAHICILFVNLAYVVFSKNKKWIWLNCLLIFINAFSFAGHLYPAWQIPLVYFFMAVAIGYLIDNKKWEQIKLQLPTRIASLSISLLLLFTALIISYLSMKDTAAIMLSTKYPGVRFSTGGNIQIHNIFTGFFGYFMSDGNLPTAWGNISEISKYLMFFPIPVYFTIRAIILKQKVSAVTISLTILIFLFLFYMIIGFPKPLAMITGFKFTPGDRMLIPFGFVNLVLTIIYLSEFKNNNLRVPAWEKLALTLFFAILTSYIVRENLTEANGFFKKSQLPYIYGFAISTSILLIFVQYKVSLYAFMTIVVLFLLPNAYSVNPLNIGFPAFTKHPIIPLLEEIKKNDPEGQWVVFGNFIVPSYLKAFNLKVFNGLTTMPNFEKMQILDNSLKNDSVYNRYGYMNIVPFINNKDSIIFQLNQPDLYTIALDPCSPKFKILGIKYFVFTYQPQPAETRCLDIVSDKYFPIYKVRNEP